MYITDLDFLIEELNSSERATVGGTTKAYYEWKEGVKEMFKPDPKPDPKKYYYGKPYHKTYKYDDCSYEYDDCHKC